MPKKLTCSAATNRHNASRSGWVATQKPVSDPVVPASGLAGYSGTPLPQKLGIKAGDTILLKRQIRRGFAPDTFYGAYLDNGLGCFVAAEVARLVAEHGGFEVPLDETMGRMQAVSQSEDGHYNFSG